MSAARQRLTPAEYLAYDAEREGKHEFWHGRIVAMAGAGPDHNRLLFRLSASLAPLIYAGQCDGFVSDQRVELPHGNYVYPDFVAACEARFDEGTPPSLLNPLLIVEVLSPSTEHVDTSTKVEGYLQIASLRAYWILDPRQRLATLYERAGERWTIRHVRGAGGVIASDLFGARLSLRDLYEPLRLPPDSEAPRLGHQDPDPPPAEPTADSQT